MTFMQVVKQWIGKLDRELVLMAGVVIAMTIASLLIIYSW